MAEPNRVLVKMLDRLFGAMLNGPGLNCRPHASRQRVDLATIGRLRDESAAEVLRALFSDERAAKIVARVRPPKIDADGEESDESKAFVEQEGLLTKLRVIAEDARTYEQDTGVHVLNVGFPLLSLPPAVLGSGSRRVLAPVAFIPVSLVIKRGAGTAVELACRLEGMDLVQPNAALLAWLEQQTGTPATAELFEDHEGGDPWREVRNLAGRVCRILDLPLPEMFKEPAPPGEGQAAADPDPLAMIDVQAIPRAEEMEGPQLLPSAVLGLFPASNQGLLRDMQAMIEDDELAGPVRSFIRAGISLDQRPEEAEPEAQAVARKVRRFEEERFVSAADPFQSRAVKTARQAQGLVIHGPPGTGKSQTITNIIADHLSRGERVLMVCDKRTALDVVANRLEHMGLGPLVALVHDAQRDQRELYRSLREQLDVLAETKTDAKAGQKLQKVDRELQEIHDELTMHWQALMLPMGIGASFHDMVGQWLALGGDSIAYEEPALAGLALAELEMREPGVRELLERGKTVAYTANLWTMAAGVSLADFLARAMSEVRARMAACVLAAQGADGTRDDAIPAFAPGLDIIKQAQARVELAARLEGIVSSVEPGILAKWAKQDAMSVDRARQRLAEVDALIRAFRAGPLDAELEPIVRSGPPRLTEVVVDLAAVDAYLEIAEKWYGFVCFGRKSAAGKVLAKYGLQLSAEAGKRVKALLMGVRARLSLMNVHRELSSFVVQASACSSEDGLKPGLRTEEAILSDAALDSSLTQHAMTLDLLHHVRSDASLASLCVPVAKVLLDPAAVPAFLDGLRKSEARATAIKALEDALVATNLMDASWLAEFSGRIRAGEEALPKVDALNDRLGTLESVLRIREALPALPSALRLAVEQSLKQGHAADDALRAMRRTVLAARITRALRANPTLQAVDAQRIESAFARYRKLDAQKQELVRDVILHQWVTKQQERLLAGTGSRLNGAGADLRRRLTLRGQRAMRLRQVVAAGQSIEGGDPLFDMAPVWMASPETVAQVFARAPLFDVVVFDEASQCRLEEALPVLVRAKRVVIAGDPKQLPPTRFFESAVATSDEEEIENEQQLFEQHQGEIEDLLAAALGLEIEQSYLDVHYRSRYPELIGFSNLHFYSSRLQPIPAHPSRRPQIPPIKLYRADGTYEKRTNEKEAMEVCGIVRELLSQRKPPSIGIACFNVTQRDLIIEKLDELAAGDADFAERLTTARERVGEGSFQGLFVKNLENVQGDERDHMIISTTYGPDANGRFYRRFGPLLQSGGGRRLNVLVTRARHQVHVVTSIPPEAYRALPQVPQGQNPNGAYLLFAYLKYAEEVQAAFARGEQVITSEVEPKAEVHVGPTRTPSAFAVALAGELARKHNLPADVYWGNDGFLVDLALRDPQDHHAVRVGLLCDGSRFTQAEDPVEWDIFRTAIHEAQGWKLMRLWTPHFFRDPEGSINAIVRAANADGLAPASSRP